MSLPAALARLFRPDPPEVQAACIAIQTSYRYVLGFTKRRDKLGRIHVTIAEYHEIGRAIETVSKLIRTYPRLRKMFPRVEGEVIVGYPYRAPVLEPKQ